MFPECRLIDINSYFLMQDKLMTVPSDASTGSSGNWLFKNKEHGKTSAAASLVCILLCCVLFTGYVSKAV